MRETTITQSDVDENGNPLSKIKLGWTKNIQHEKIVPVAVMI